MAIRALHDALMRQYGPQRWWPANDAFEIVVGALLVQQTAWANVEKAIAALDGAGLLDCDALADAAPETLEPLVRPAGFFRTKARRLKHVAGFVRAAGGIDGLRALPTAALRAALLEQDGIGPETADAILLYAFERPAAVMDLYTRRLVARLGPPVDPGSEARLRDAIVASLDSVDALNEFHALVVEHGKQRCRKTPLCDACVLSRRCAHAARRATSAA